MGSVRFDAVDKIYPNGFRAVSGLSLDIEDGEFLVLVGPSGCGKSTALRMIAGLENASSGTLWIGDRCVNAVEPKNRDIAMVFQNYALYPHMTVAENIGFALKMARTPKAEKQRRIIEAASILGLEGCLDSKPSQLSGGQRQRVAMGRAIVREPSVFLMDEPLSNLDAKLRVYMRAEVARLQRELGVTTIYVTHDQVEAMTMGDRVAVMKGGVLQQVDSPEMLYDRPKNVFVGGFIGSPSMNLFEGRVRSDNGAVCLEIGSQRLQIPSHVYQEKKALATDQNGGRVIVGLRPEDLHLGSSDASDDETIDANIDLVESLGGETVAYFEIDAKSISSDDPYEEREVGQGRTRIVARFGPRTGLKPGDNVRVRVNMENLHFFHCDDHTAIP